MNRLCRIKPIYILYDKSENIIGILKSSYTPHTLRYRNDINQKLCKQITSPEKIKSVLNDFGIIECFGKKFTWYYHGMKTTINVSDIYKIDFCYSYTKEYICKYTQEELYKKMPIFDYRQLMNDLDTYVKERK